MEAGVIVNLYPGEIIYYFTCSPAHPGSWRISRWIMKVGELAAECFGNSDLSIVDCLSLHIYYFHLSFPVLIAVLFISLSVIFGVAFWRGVLVWCPGVATRNCPYFARLYDVVCGGVIFGPPPPRQPPPASARVVIPTTLTH